MSCKPKNTDETLSSTKVPGARETASGSARNQVNDGSLVKGTRDEMAARKEHNTKQVGGHAKK